jgi:hypothetical protein
MRQCLAWGHGTEVPWKAVLLAQMSFSGSRRY